MKIKIKYSNPKCKIESFGDWIDLRAAKTMELASPFSKKGIPHKVNFDYALIPLGISMKLPKYYEAMVLPRSSTFKKYGITMWNSEGVIDNTFAGNDDQWHFPAIAFADTTIPEGDRICQFRIQLSQNAPWYAKVKWLFSNKIKFVEVDDLSDNNRGGFGTSGSN